MGWGAGASFVETFSPMFLQAAQITKKGNDQKSATAHDLELQQLQHESQSPDPKIRDMANAGLFLRAKEAQPGYKGKPAKNLLEQIHSGKFQEHEAFKQYTEIGNAFDAGKKTAGEGAAPQDDFHVTQGTTDQFNKNPAFGVASGGPPSVPPPMIAAPQPGDPAYGDNAPGMPQAPPAPAAQIEGTGNIKPSAPMMSAAPALVQAAPVAPPTEPTLQDDMAEAGFRQDSHKSYGPQGDALLPTMLSRRVSRKDELAVKAKAKLAQDREDARVLAAKTKRETDLERQDIKLKAQMERLDKSIKAKGKGGSSGPKQGINYEKERLEAKTDYERYTNALELHAAAEQANLERDAAKNDWDPTQYKAAQDKLDASIAKRQKALEDHHAKVTELLYGGKAGGPPSDGGPPVVAGGGGKPSGGPPTVAGAPSAKIVQKNSTTGEFRHSLDGGKTWQPGK